MSPRFVLGRENVPCVAEVVNRSLKADCTDFNNDMSREMWTPNKLFSLAAWPISFPFFFILLRGRLTDDFVLIKSNLECASKEKSTMKVNLFKST